MIIYNKSIIYQDFRNKNNPKKMIFIIGEMVFFKYLTKPPPQAIRSRNTTSRSFRNGNGNSCAVFRHDGKPCR